MVEAAGQVTGERRRPAASNDTVTRTSSNQTAESPLPHQHARGLATGPSYKRASERPVNGTMESAPARPQQH
jgi:hypothetical protein